MNFELTILGCSSATPTSERNPTAQVLNVLERFFLIDCGEGTQMQMRRNKIKFQRISHIFISHLHGDHYLGLMGLLSSMHLLGRKHDLHLYGNPVLKEIVDIHLKAGDTRLNYPLHFHPLTYDKSELLFEDDKVTVHTIILNHRIPCCGFLFREKPRPRHIIREKLKQYNVPVWAINNIRNGEDFITEEGKTIPNEELTNSPPPPRAYAYCSDTRYNESIIPQLEGVDLLYHEATFMQDMLPRAELTYHSTAREAATIALKAKAGQLIIGHYSARYGNLQPLLEEAKEVFANTLLAEEGKKYDVELRQQ